MVYFMLCAAILLIDFFTKYWAKNYLCGLGSIPLWKDVFHLTYVENRGAAFGILQDKQLFFVIIAVVALAVIVFVMHKYKNKSKILNLGLAFVGAGAAGNLIDRLTVGFVVDFFDFRLIDFPVFNVADIFVCMGAALVAFFVIFIEEKITKQPKECDQNAD